MGMEWKTGSGLSVSRLGLGLGHGHVYAATGTTVLGTALVIAAGVLIVAGLVGLAARRRKREAKS